ncbi:hypothetical protein GQ472_01550 [archaeon]|nr:hypothetical protein [archaeon]
MGNGYAKIEYICKNCHLKMSISVTMSEKLRIIGRMFSGIDPCDPDKFRGDTLYVLNNLSRCCSHPDWHRKDVK